MAKKYLDLDGLSHFWQAIKNAFVADVTYDSSTKKIQKTKAGTTSDVVTLSTVATSGSYSDLSNKPTIPTLKNVFGKVKVGSTTIEADTTQDTLEIAAGSNVTVTPDATNDKITIAATDTKYSDFTGATDSAAGAHGLVPAPSSGDTSAVIFSDGKWHTFGVGRNAESVLITHRAPSESPQTLLTIGTASTTLAGAMSPSNYNKLYGIAEGAEVNQNAFSNVKVGSTTVAADSKTDTVEFVAGSNITLTPDAANDKITIAATDTTYSDFTGATSSAAGIHGLVPAPAQAMNASNILSADGSWRYLTVRDESSGDWIGVVDAEDTAGGAELQIKIKAAGNGGTAYGTSGLMTGSDKTKLNGIATGAEVNQNAFSNVKVGSTTVAADTKTDTLELAGSNVTVTPDATNDKVTIGITASNVTTALGNTAVARATADASGNTITSTYAPKASPALTGTPTAPTATAGTNSTQIATTAFVTSAVQTAITGAAAFQGTAPTSFAPTNYKKGYYWVVGTAGTYAGQVCEPGDMIFAVKDYGSAYAAADFNVIQTNLDITSITNSEIDTIVAA